MHRFAAIILLWGWVGAGAVAYGQDACNTLVCPDGSTAIGEPAQCQCPEPPPVNKPEPLTCERHFGCADGAQVGIGEWPNCACRSLETPKPAPGTGVPDGAPDAGMGQLDNCNAFFECSPGYQMILWNGKCVCGDEMLPPVE